MGTYVGQKLQKKLFLKLKKISKKELLAVFHRDKSYKFERQGK